MTAVAALGLTVAVELPLYVLGLVALRLAHPWHAVLLGVGVNLLTHPVLWYVLAPDPTASLIIVAEVVVCLVEAAVIWLVVRQDGPLLFVLALGANAASFGAGLLFSAVHAG
jgi:hypothetical protein